MSFDFQDAKEFAGLFRDVGLIIGMPILIHVGIRLYKQQIESLKAQIELLKTSHATEIKSLESTRFDKAHELIDSQKKLYGIKIELLNQELISLKEEKIALSKRLTTYNDNSEEFAVTKSNLYEIDSQINALGLVLERTVSYSGCIDLSHVANQGNIKAFAKNTYERRSLRVSDLPTYFMEFAKNNFNDRYLEYDTEYHKDSLPDDKKLKILINETRISTFFCFTDGSSVLLFDRANSKWQNVKNDYWDCFGSVTFENISIKLKLGQESVFLDSIVDDIDLIPGFVYEDNIEPQEKSINKQTVIMFGFVIYLSNQDLNNAIASETGNLRLFPIKGNSISSDLLTAKADISLAYLRDKNA